MALPQPAEQPLTGDARAARCAATARPALEMSLRSIGCGHARLRLSGELDVASAGDLDAALCAQLAAGRRVIEIDAAGLRFCDAAGLGVLVAAQRGCQAIGGRLHLIAVPPAIARLLSITGLTGLLPRLDSPDITRPHRGLHDAAEQPVRP